MLSAVILGLELLNLMILFAGVFGYAIEERKIWLVAGIAVFAAEWGIVMMWPNLGQPLYFVQMGFPAIGMTLMLSGKRGTVFLISLCMIGVFDLVGILYLGLLILYFNGDMAQVMNVNWYPLSLCGSLVFFLVLSFLLRKMRKKIHVAVERLNPTYLLFFIPCWYLITQMAYWSSDIEGWEILHGANLVKSGILSLLIIAVFVLIGVLITERREMKRMLYLNRRCIVEQTNQYCLLSDRDRQLRKFRHDYNGHIAVLQRLAGEASREKLLDYIRALATIGNNSKIICTNNMISDAILNQYAEICEEDKIELMVKGNFPSDLTILETDLCVILSNAVKNAYESTKVCSVDKRRLQIEFKNMKNFAEIQIVNPAKEKPVIENGIFVSTKKDKENHGFGIENMLEAAEKYGGEITWTYKDGNVITDILLRCETA